MKRDILDSIGRTPFARIKRLSSGSLAEVPVDSVWVPIPLRITVIDETVLGMNAVKSFVLRSYYLDQLVWGMHRKIDVPCVVLIVSFVLLIGALTDFIIRKRFD